MQQYRARFEFSRFEGNYAVGKLVVDRNYVFSTDADGADTVEAGLNKIVVSGVSALGAKNFVAIRNNVKYITNPADKDKVTADLAVNMALFCIEHTVKIPVVRDPAGNVFIACYVPLVGVTLFNRTTLDWEEIGAERLFDSIKVGLNADPTADGKKHVLVLYDGEQAALGDGDINNNLEEARAGGFTAKQSDAEKDADGTIIVRLERSIMGVQWPFRAGTGAELNAYEKLVNDAHGTALRSAADDGSPRLVPAPVEFIEGVNEQVVRAGSTARSMTREAMVETLQHSGRSNIVGIAMQRLKTGEQGDILLHDG